MGMLFFFLFLSIYNRPLHYFFSLFKTIVQLCFLLKLHSFTLSHSQKFSFFTFSFFNKVRLPCNDSNEEEPQQQKVKNWQVLKEAGVYTVVETEAFLLFFFKNCLAFSFSLLT